MAVQKSKIPDFPLVSKVKNFAFNSFLSRNDNGYRSFLGEKEKRNQPLVFLQQMLAYPPKWRYNKMKFYVIRRKFL
jgi:hypothetical protein